MKFRHSFTLRGREYRFTVWLYEQTLAEGGRITKLQFTGIPERLEISHD